MTRKKQAARKYEVVKKLPPEQQAKVQRLVQIDITQNTFNQNKERITEIREQLRRKLPREEKKSLAMEALSRINENKFLQQRLNKFLPKRKVGIRNFDSRLREITGNKTRFETRIHSDFVLIRGRSTPCKAIGQINRTGLVSTTEAYLALAGAHIDAARSQLQGTPPSPWRGIITLIASGDAANCGISLAKMLQRFAHTPERKIDFVRELRMKEGVKLAGTVSVSYRIVSTVENRFGRKVERYEYPRGYPTVVTNFGEAIDFTQTHEFRDGVKKGVFIKRKGKPFRVGRITQGRLIKFNVPRKIGQ